VRSFLLICGTILLLGAGLFLYLWFQPAVAERPLAKLAQRQAASRPTSTTKISGLGTVDSAWILRIDPRTGELASRFRGNRYDPQAGNIVLVDHPQAEFFSNDGKQRIHIDGITGRVHVAGATANQKPGTFAGKMEAPSRGLLNDVTVTIFEPADSTTPSVTIRMPNASFDNDAFRLETEAYDDAVTRQHIAADQVPVELRGTDYDFDGKGLVLIWNERDRKLQLLEIAHGQRLVIKNPKMLKQTNLAGAQSRASDGPLPDMLVSRDANAVRLIAQPQPAARRSAASHKRAATHTAPPATTRQATTAPTLYRATFHDNVKITEADKPVATADVMHVDFMQGPGKSTTQPVQTPAANPAPRREKQLTAPHAPQPSASSEPQTSSASTSSTPASPSQGPITINWTGKLRVTPITEANEQLQPDKALVQLIGNPVTLQRDQSNIVAAQAIYNSANQSADLQSSESVPLVRMTDARGATVATPRMIYRETSPTQKIATLIGPSTAELPDTSDPSSKKIIRTGWNDRCILQLVTDAQNRTFMHHADLAGAVAIDHPRLNMTSDALALAFAPPVEKPLAITQSSTSTPMADAQLKQVIASGNVHAKMIDDESNAQTISTQKLLVQTETDSSGQTYARVIDATGEVHTRGTTGDLTAGHLIATLKPTTRQSTTSPSTEPTAPQLAAGTPTTHKSHRPTSQPFSSGADLESLVAEDHVRFTTLTTQPSVATADVLKIHTEENLQRIHLIGTTQPASVASASSTLSSKLIRFTPEANRADIPGPGHMHATSQPSRNGAPATQPDTMDIAWQGNASIDGNTNLIVISEGVEAISRQSDGTRNTATARQLTATLTTRPSAASSTTQPDTQTARHTTTAPSLMESKDIASVTLTADAESKVEVKSELMAPNGTLLRGFNLFAQTVIYDKIRGQMIVPVPGMMLYQDHRAPAQTSAEGPTVGSGRGATAFEWKKSLIYSEPDRRATLAGDVAIVHRPKNNKDQPFRLDAQTVTADLEPAASTQSSDASTKSSEKMTLKLVTARDNVHVSSNRANFDASELTYSPATSTLSATGAEDNPGTLYDATNGSTATFSALQWNTETDQFTITQANARIRR
jgi:hypothetical protein